MYGIRTNKHKTKIPANEAKIQMIKRVCIIFWDISNFTHILRVPYAGKLDKLSIVIDNDASTWTTGNFDLDIYKNTTLIYSLNGIVKGDFTAETSGGIVTNYYYNQGTSGWETVNQTIAVGDRLTMVYTGNTLNVSGWEYHVQVTALFTS